MTELQEAISGLLMCEPEAIPAYSTPLREIEGWDSLKHVLLIVGLENKLKAKLTAEEIQAIITVEDVGRILKEKASNV